MFLLSPKGHVYQLQQQQQLPRLAKARPWEESGKWRPQMKAPSQRFGKDALVVGGTDSWFSPGPRHPSLLLFFGLELTIPLFELLECLVLGSH